MKPIYSCFLVLFLLMTFAVNAQDFQGVATYQTKTKFSIDLSTSGIPADRIKMIEERMKSELEKTYTLNFNKVASIYKEEQKLTQSEGGPGGGGPGGGMRFMMMGGSTTGNYYKNTSTKTSTKENEFSGKNFLVKDNLVSYNWKMEQETKMIGNYLCFKATTIVEMAEKKAFNFRRPEDRKEEEKEPEKPKMESVIVTAWYSLDIPVNHGPGDYWGLPGLILEISYGETNIMCTKIVMNPKEKTNIEEPSKGKEVTDAEYNTIVEEKTKEMQERFKDERQKSGNDGPGSRRRG